MLLKRKAAQFRENPVPGKGLPDQSAKDAAKMKGDSREIFLGFTSDPYQPVETQLRITRGALEILIRHGLRFTVPTKGGNRAARDFDLFRDYPLVRLGASFSLYDDDRAASFEPGTVPVSERISVLERAAALGISTWACLEPIIDPAQTLALMDRLSGIVHRWVPGKLNYRKPEKPVDWRGFRSVAAERLDRMGADYQFTRSFRKR